MARCRRVLAEHQLDPFGLECVSERLSERRGFARQNVIGALDERHLRAHPAHRLRHLDADRSAAEHEHPPWYLLQPGGLAVRPDAAEPAQSVDRRDDRIRAGRHHDVGCRELVASHLDPAGPNQPPRATQEVDPHRFRPGDRARVVVVRHLEVAPLKCRPRVDAVSVQRLARARRLTCVLDHLARTQQRLRRDARPVRALPAEELAFDDRHLEATRHERPRAVLARRPTAQDDHVVVRAHRGRVSPNGACVTSSARRSAPSAGRPPTFRPGRARTRASSRPAGSPRPRSSGWPPRCQPRGRS